jgi:hypothetical protein
MIRNLLSVLKISVVASILFWAVNQAQARSCGSGYSPCMSTCGSNEGSCNEQCELDSCVDEACNPDPDTQACLLCEQEFSDCQAQCTADFNGCSTTCYDEYCE